MNSLDDRDPIDELADQFLQQIRHGRQLSIEEFAAVHPQHSQDIRDLFPLIINMEQLKESWSGAAARGPVSELAPGTRLGDFRIVRRIGQGGMGVVYEAEQEPLGRRVALKVLAAHLSQSARQIRRFRREAETAANLHHTHIVPVFGAGADAGQQYFAMQLIQGVGLDRILAARRQRGQTREGGNLSETGSPLAETAQSTSAAAKSTGGARQHPDESAEDLAQRLAVWLERGEQLEAGRALAAADLERRGPGMGPTDDSQWKRLARWAFEAAQALAHAHQHGVLHRDVKPANLIVDAQHNLWVTDFGLAKLAADVDLTGVGEVLGTLRYMAPEQLQGISDPRSDLYGLGLTMYELVANRPAFDDRTPGGLIQQRQSNRLSPLRPTCPTLPADLETIILKACAVDPNDRYETADGLAEDLERFLVDLPIRARPLGTMERWWRWSRRNPGLSSALALLVVSLMALAALSSWAYWQTKQNLVTTQKAEVAALESQRRAEQNLELATSAFESIFENVAQRGSGLTWQLELELPWSETPGVHSELTPADAQLLSELLGFYQQFAANNRGDNGLRLKIAEAYHRMARIIHRLPQSAEADRYFQQAIEEYRIAAEVLAEPQAAFLGEVRAHNDWAVWLAGQGRQFPEAMETHRAGLERWHTFPETWQETWEARLELARTYDLMGSLFQRDEMSEIQTGEGRPPPFERRGAGKKGPGRQNRRGDLSDTGDVPPPVDFGYPGDLVGTNAENRLGLGIPPPPLVFLPNGHDSPETLARGRPRLDRGPAADLTRAQRILDELLRERPDEEAIQNAVADCERHRFLFMVRRPPRAETRELFGQIVARLRRLVEQYPDKTPYRVDLAQTLSWASGTALQFDPEVVQEHLTEAFGIFEELVAEFPQRAHYRERYAVALSSAARWSRETKRKESGLKWLRQAERQLGFLGQESKASVSYRVAWSLVHLEMACAEWDESARDVTQKQAAQQRLQEVIDYWHQAEVRATQPQLADRLLRRAHLLDWRWARQSGDAAGVERAESFLRNLPGPAGPGWITPVNWWWGPLLPWPWLRSEIPKISGERDVPASPPR